MDPIQAGIAEFQRTISDLQSRLANMAMENAQLKNRIAELTASATPPDRAAGEPKT